MKPPLRFEMTTTRAEFLRLLPAAVNHLRFVEEDGTFVHRDGARRWRIGLTPLSDLRLGMIRLERYGIDIDFAGYSDAEIADYLARFELYFRRGGG